MSTPIFTPNPEREVRIAVVGVGGTGSELLSHLTRLHNAQQARAFGGIHVTAFDPDTVSQANIVRQRYFTNDIGRSKAHTLIERINTTCALTWEAVSRKLTKTDLRTQSFDIVISCVDTRSARDDIRSMLDRTITSYGNERPPARVWIDCGNTQHSGQVVLGTPGARLIPKRVRRAIVPCVHELHPEIVDRRLDILDPPSCSALEALAHQGLMVNAMTATIAVDLLDELLTTGTVAQHARYFDLRKGTMAGRPTPDAPCRQARAANKPTQPRRARR